MRIFLFVMLALSLSFGCGGEEDEKPMIDADGDTVAEAEDCDDDDSALGAIAEDSDCDGVLTADDCDDADAESTTLAIDGDCDAVLTADDCDDADAESTVVAEDGDCDGVLIADDCDDANPESTVVAEDGDCDTVLTADDCDDADAESTVVAEDGDCDAVLTADDCDDDDAESTTVATDGDCDAVLTADDCDDGDEASTIRSEDADCDSAVTIVDCDDEDSTLGSVLHDHDCDGTLTDLDCDDFDVSSTTLAIDADCDGVVTAEDCDDGDADSTTVATDGDCDTVLTADDCDDADAESTTVATDGDCDTVLTADDCNDDDAESTTVATDADCDTVLTADDCDDHDSDSTTVATDADCDTVLTEDDCDDDDAESTTCNTPPLAPEISISPASPIPGEDDLVCIIDLSAADAEGDAIFYTFEWTVDGIPFADTATTIEAGDTIPAASTSADEEWTCTVTPNDGESDGASVDASVYILGGLPWDATNDLSLADYSFVGENAGEYAGKSVSSAGDVDGDGLDDLLVGAQGNDDGGSSAGKAYLILGASLGSSGTIDLSAADYSFVGEEAEDYAGTSVSSAGDVDGDGLDDLLVGAKYYDNDDSYVNAGKAYLILGASLGSISEIDLSLADYSFVGELSGDQAGTSVSSAGDVDGDGLDDLLVGAQGNDDGADSAGKAYLILGASLGSSSTIDLSAADYSFVGEEAEDYAGTSVSSAGDVDGDGLDDLLVGAPRNEMDVSSAGKAYLILAASLGSISTIDLSAADYSFVGEYAGDHAGNSVSRAGDVDGDGRDDLLVGANRNDDGDPYAGKAYLILASSLGTSSSIDLSAADYRFVGERPIDYAGVSVSGAGDVDGDGLDDLLVGANGGGYDGGSRAGKAYLILGASLGSSSTIDLSAADYSFVGEYASDHAGSSVSGAGDVDGDGLDDLLVGAYANDDGGSIAGKAYLLLTGG